VPLLEDRRCITESIRILVLANRIKQRIKADTPLSEDTLLDIFIKILLVFLRDMVKAKL